MYASRTAARCSSGTVSNFPVTLPRASSMFLNPSCVTVTVARPSAARSLHGVQE